MNEKNLLSYVRVGHDINSKMHVPSKEYHFYVYILRYFFDKHDHKKYTKWAQFLDNNVDTNHE